MESPWGPSDLGVKDRKDKLASSSTDQNQRLDQNHRDPTIP